MPGDRWPTAPDDVYPFKNHSNIRIGCDLVLADGGTWPAPGVDYGCWSVDAAVERAPRLAPGSAVYVKSDFMGAFFEAVFPLITVPIVLVTAGEVTPTPGRYRARLDDPKIARWFGQNCDLESTHPKYRLLPLGLTDPYIPHGDQKTLLRIRARMPPVAAKPLLALATFHFNPNHPERVDAASALAGMPWVHFEQQRVAPRKTWQRHADFAFVLSPRGVGLDCHRTWEALILSSIPIVKASTLDPLYREYPVVIVKSWDEITPVAMDAWRRRLQARFDEGMIEHLTARYWRAQIAEASRRAARRPSD
jgi:hypothetical protein